MYARRSSLGSVALLLAALLGAAACEDVDLPVAPDPAAAESPAAKGPRERFTVFSQNVYLGGDTDPIFSVDFADLPAVIAATNTFWGQVLASRIPERAAAIVDELAESRPHMVGLQEATRFLVLDLGAGGAVVESQDLLAAIAAEIAARGLPYVLARSQENTTVTLPLSPRLVLRVTDRLAVLQRTDVQVNGLASGKYAARSTIGPVTLERGWIRVTAIHEGVPFHFVNTHLETQRLAPIQAAQAAELIHGVAGGLDGVTLLAGDLNSDAAHPGAPSWTPTYDAMIAAGFTDLWVRGHGGEAGYTCCQASDLSNPGSTLDERIDFVMARDPGSADGIQGAADIGVVGAEEADRTGSGLWRADHAGLVASLKLAPVRTRAGN